VAASQTDPMQQSCQSAGVRARIKGSQRGNQSQRYGRPATRLASRTQPSSRLSDEASRESHLFNCSTAGTLLLARAAQAITWRLWTCISRLSSRASQHDIDTNTDLTFLSFYLERSLLMRDPRNISKRFLGFLHFVCVGLLVAGAETPETEG